MNHVKCTSCLEVLPLEAFRLLTCGHAFCNTCALNWIEACRDQAKRPTCPACRHTFSKNDLRPVYITFATVGEVAQAKEDMTKGKAKDVAEKIGLMDATSPAKSVERAAVELEKVAQSISSLDGSQQADTRDLILGAVLEFKDRIAPLYAEVAVNRDRIKELKKSNAALESNSRKLEAGSARLNEKLTEALDTAEEAAVQIVSLRAENRILQQQTEKLETDVAYLNQSLAEKKKEALEWRSRVTKFKKNETIREARIRELKKDKERLEQEIEDLRNTVNERTSMATSSHPVGFDDDSVTEDDSEAEDFVPWTKGHLESENQPPYSSQSYLPSRPTSLHASNGLSSPAYPADPNPITSMKRGLFHSEWNLPAPPSYADKKRKIISKQSSLPLDLDGKGRAKKPVQVGPTRKVRC